VKKLSKAKKTKIILFVSFLILSIPIGMFLYHINKPIFRYNYIEDDFEDQIIGLFPMGWLSAINPQNMRVVSDGGNKVMEITSKTSQEYGTEVLRRFKKTSIGVIECKVKSLDIEAGFGIHLPQTEREYDPFDDIIIMFSKGEIYVIGGDDITEIDEGTSLWWYSVLAINKDKTWIITKPEVSVMSYEANVWYTIRIDFTRESFFLAVNGDSLGEFNYPKYNPPYFASLYFYPLGAIYNFKFYVDNVKITLSNPVDYMHPMNIFLLLVIPISALGFINLHYLLKLKKKRN